MRAKILAGLVLAAAIFLTIEIYQIHRGYLLAQSGIPPIGKLGLPLGTFTVIEGTEHETSLLLGQDDFVVESVNGVKPDRELKIILTPGSKVSYKLVPGKRYVLHGSEYGEWSGAPPLPKSEPDPPELHAQQTGLHYTSKFWIDSVEKIDGVTVPDARILDPGQGLAHPDFNARMTATDIPLGRLGLPIGTFAVVEVHTPDPMLPMTGNDFFLIDAVNGSPFVSPSKWPLGVHIGHLPMTKNNAHVIVHGYEMGMWGGSATVPYAEDPYLDMAPLAFGLQLHFVMTSQEKN